MEIIPNILVVGSMNMDLVTRAERMPAIGETISGTGFNTIPGGKGANQAVASARMGANVAFIGCVGDDVYGNTLVEALSKENINVERIEKIKDTPTGIATIIVDEKGNNSIVVVPGANALVSTERLHKSRELINWCNTIVLQLEIPLDTVIESIIEGKKKDKTIIFNPAPVQELDEKIYKYVDYLIVNEIEAKQISKVQENNHRELVESLLSMGFKNVLMTVGEQGVWFNKENSIQHIPAIKVKAVDTTAAGDSFVGAFATFLAKGLDKESAIKLAVKAASITVTRIGAQSSLPYLREI